MGKAPQISYPISQIMLTCCPVGKIVGNRSRDLRDYALKKEERNINSKTCPYYRKGGHKKDATYVTITIIDECKNHIYTRLFVRMPNKIHINTCENRDKIKTK